MMDENQGKPVRIGTASVRYTTTPLPSRTIGKAGGPNADAAKINGRPAAADDGKTKPEDPCVRAETEDDDGYDPYSDRQPRTPLFEENPWD